MPKNKGKGGKNRRRGKNENESEKRELIFKEDEQEYAQVTKMLGNGRLEAMCFDGVKRLCHIRGKLRKKVSTTSGIPLLWLGKQRNRCCTKRGKRFVPGRSKSKYEGGGRTLRFLLTEQNLTPFSAFRMQVCVCKSL